MSQQEILLTFCCNVQNNVTADETPLLIAVDFTISQLFDFTTKQK